MKEFFISVANTIGMLIVSTAVMFAVWGLLLAVQNTEGFITVLVILGGFVGWWIITVILALLYSFVGFRKITYPFVLTITSAILSAIFVWVKWDFNVWTSILGTFMMIITFARFWYCYVVQVNTETRAKSGKGLY